MKSEKSPLLPNALNTCVPLCVPPWPWVLGGRAFTVYLSGTESGWETEGEQEPHFVSEDPQSHGESRLSDKTRVWQGPYGFLLQPQQMTAHEVALTTRCVITRAVGQKPEAGAST